MNVTVKIDGFCTANNHIGMSVTTPQGVVKLTLTKADFQIDPVDLEVAIIAVLKNFVKESGLTNWTQIKTAIEGKVFKI